MSETLSVFWGTKLAGRLRQEDNGDFAFQYTPGGCLTPRQPLSQSGSPCGQSRSRMKFVVFFSTTCFRKGRLARSLPANWVSQRGTTSSFLRLWAGNARERCPCCPRANRQATRAAMNRSSRKSLTG